jgi:hypothetical protein
MNRETTSTVLAVIAAACGIAAIVTRPFLFAPIGLLCLLAGTRMTRNQRFTRPAAAILALGALAGAAVAAAFAQPLY